MINLLFSRLIVNFINDLMKAKSSNDQMKNYFKTEWINDSMKPEFIKGRTNYLLNDNYMIMVIRWRLLEKIIW